MLNLVQTRNIAFVLPVILVYAGDFSVVPRQSRGIGDVIECSISANRRLSFSAPAVIIRRLLPFLGFYHPWIIALCRVNDWRDNASPQENGWFLSDFHLFRYLLENSSRCYGSSKPPCSPSFTGLTRRLDDFRSSKQLWLTCVDRKTLVSKYGEYVHGNLNGDQRAVLDDGIF